MEKQLVSKYNISWKEARDVLQEVQKECDSKDPATLLEAASNRFLARQTQQKEIEEQMRIARDIRTHQVAEAQRKLDEHERMMRAESLVVDSRGSVNFATSMPASLEKAGVTLEKWTWVRETVVKELAPLVEAARCADAIVLKGLSNYMGGQVARGFVDGALGAALDGGHERKMFKKVLADSYVHADASMIAANILARANFWLNSFGVLAQLVYEESVPFPADRKDYFASVKSRIPIGLEFHVQ